VLVVDAMVDKPLVRKEPRVPPGDPSTITVAVSPDDVNKLLVAERTGTLIATLVSEQDVQGGIPAAAPAPLTRRELLGLKDPPPPRRYTVEKWSGTTLRVFDMSDERIRESREVTSGRREEPVEAPPPPADNRQTLVPTGAVNPYAAALPAVSAK
jgi:hypothetical protein